MFLMGLRIFNFFSSTILCIFKPFYLIYDYFQASRTQATKTIIAEINGLALREQKNILCFFAHYDKCGFIEDYVVHHVASLSDAGCNIIFLTSANQESEIRKIEKYVSKIIIRKNIGHDFGAWATAFLTQGYEDYNYVLLTNDSVYGPLFDLKDIFSKISETGENIDCWGLTENWDKGYHLQSYFLILSKNLVSSSFFQDFWKHYKLFSNRNTVIRHGEIALTNLMLKNAINMKAIFPYFRILEKAHYKFNNFKEAVGETSRYHDKNMQTIYSYIFKNRLLCNSPRYFWQELIQSFNFPYIKVNLLRDNKYGVSNTWSWQTLIEELSKYDTSLINKHLIRVKKISKFRFSARI